MIRCHVPPVWHDLVYETCHRDRLDRSNYLLRSLPMCHSWFRQCVRNGHHPDPSPLERSEIIVRPRIRTLYFALADVILEHRRIPRGDNPAALSHTR